MFIALPILTMLFILFLRQRETILSTLTFIFLTLGVVKLIINFII